MVGVRATFNVTCTSVNCIVRFNFRAKIYSYLRTRDKIDAQYYTRPVERLHGGVHDPDLRLPRSPRRGFELGQKHVIKEHEPLTNLPWGGLVRLPLRFDFERRRTCNSTRRELTAISSKYFLSFLAIRYASSLRVMGSRCLFQRLVDTFYRSQCMTTHPERSILPGLKHWEGILGT